MTHHHHQAARRRPQLCFPSTLSVMLLCLFAMQPCCVFSSFVFKTVSSTTRKIRPPASLCLWEQAEEVVTAERSKQDPPLERRSKRQWVRPSFTRAATKTSSCSSNIADKMSESEKEHYFDPTYLEGPDKVFNQLGGPLAAAAAFATSVFLSTATIPLMPQAAAAYAAVAPSVPSVAIEQAAPPTSPAQALVTQSELGLSVRRAVVSGARLADRWDLQWERWSDARRDEGNCDPVTGRRLFDNGFRRDGTRVGNPVLGALCHPEPLPNVDPAVVQTVLDKAVETATELLKQDRTSLQRRSEQVEQLVRPSFSRAVAAAEPSSSLSSESNADGMSESEKEQAMKRQNYNKDVYAQMRAYGEVMEQTAGSKVDVLKQNSRLFDQTWGRKMLTTLAPSANRKDYKSPFPKPDPTDEQPYDEGALLDALGAVSVALNKLQAGGLIGRWEMSIPEDDYWNVVTIAVDDDCSIGGQILARERNQALGGSPVVALVRSALEDRAISHKLDTFFIDPTTTAQERYNPTQLLVNLYDLGQ